MQWPLSHSVYPLSTRVLPTPAVLANCSGVGQQTNLSNLQRLVTQTHRNHAVATNPPCHLSSRALPTPAVPAKCSGTGSGLVTRTHSKQCSGHQSTLVLGMSTLSLPASAALANCHGVSSELVTQTSQHTMQWPLPNPRSDHSSSHMLDPSAPPRPWLRITDTTHT